MFQDRVRKPDGKGKGKGMIKGKKSGKGKGKAKDHSAQPKRAAAPDAEGEQVITPSADRLLFL